MFSPFSTLHRSFSSSHLPILFLSPLNKTKIKIKTNKHMKKQIKSLKNMEYIPHCLAIPRHGVYPKM